MLQDFLGPSCWARRLDGASAPPVAGQPGSWPLPLRRVQRAEAAASGAPPAGAWWLQFGPDPSPDAAALTAIAGLRVLAVPPQGLACVQLWHQGQVVYQLDTTTDSRGNLLHAGDMLQGMASMQGHDALVIDARGLGLAPAATALHLLLTADAWVSPGQVQVTLLSH